MPTEYPGQEECEMEREFVFNCTAPDGQSARAQIAAALEKRMDLYSRERLPWLWGLADRLNRVEKVSQQVSDRRARVRRVLGTVDWVLGTMLLAAAWTEPAELPLLLVVGIVGTVLGILCLWKRRRAVLAVLHLALGVVFLMASFGDPAELGNLMSLGLLYLVIGIAAIAYKKRKAGNPYEQQAGPLAELLAEVAGQNVRLIFSDTGLKLAAGEDVSQEIPYEQLEYAFETSDLVMLALSHRAITLQKKDLTEGTLPDLREELARTRFADLQEERAAPSEMPES